MVTSEVPPKVMVQVRLSAPLVKEVDHLSVEWEDYRAGTIERLLRQALDQLRQQGHLWEGDVSTK